MPELNNESSESSEVSLNPAVTPAAFREWRSPRFGKSNPERMNNPVWEWLVKSRLNANRANERMNGPSRFNAGPAWCFARFGQSSTQLPDGGVILIAGEHEDHYDPDFYIYNDVVVQQPDGRLDIFGYPRAVFPPTDFHSATIVGSRIIIVGNLGYPQARKPGVTPVYVLELGTFKISKIKPKGASPGWIHKHEARLSEDNGSILITRGILDRGVRAQSLVENIDDWRLHLADWRWERLTERRWQRWEVRRTDGQPNHLWQIQRALFEQQIPELKQALQNHVNLMKDLQVPTLEEELGCAPNLAVFERLYKPELPHGSLPAAEEEYNVHRIRVQGVIVRYVEDMRGIQMTIEGDLPEQTVNLLIQDLLNKLSSLENTRCELVKL